VKTGVILTHRNLFGMKIGGYSLPRMGGMRWSLFGRQTLQAMPLADLSGLAA
jgi:hypothetical protein